MFGVWKIIPFTKYDLTATVVICGYPHDLGNLHLGIPQQTVPAGMSARFRGHVPQAVPGPKYQ